MLCYLLGRPLYVTICSLSFYIIVNVFAEKPIPFPVDDTMAQVMHCICGRLSNISQFHICGVLTVICHMAHSSEDLTQAFFIYSSIHDFDIVGPADVSQHIKYPRILASANIG